MNTHYHVNLETFAVNGLMVLLFLNVVRITAAMAVKSNVPLVQHAGKAVGGLIYFGG